MALSLFRAPEATTGAAPVVPPLIWRLGRTQGGTCVYPSGVEAVGWLGVVWLLFCSLFVRIGAASWCVFCLMGAAMAPPPFV